MRRIGAPVAFLVAFLVLAFAASRTEAALPAEQPYGLDSRGRLTTDVYVNGQGPFRFLIDTASSRSLIYEHVRQQLNLTRSQPDRMTVYGINEVADVMPVMPQELRVAGESVSGLTMGVLPDTKSSGLDGILGVDVLARYFVVLDRSTMRIKLMKPGASSARVYSGWSEAELIPRKLKKFDIQFWYLKARFNGSSITSLFDLGANLTMLNWDAAERLGAHRAHYEHFGPPPTLLQDVLGKEAPAIRVDGLDVSLPGKAWRQQSVIVADAPVFSHFDMEEAPAAIVGLELLRNSSLAIDFQGQRLYLGPTVADGS